MVSYTCSKCGEKFSMISKLYRHFDGHDEPVPDKHHESKENGIMLQT